MIKAVIFDLDGVLYIGDKVVAGTVEAISTLSQDYQIFYLTNNSGKSQEQIIQKLRMFGFGANDRNTYCGSYALVAYLAENKISPVYLIGTESLRKDLISHNIKVEHSSEVPAVVVGLDPNFGYDKIAIALEAIRNGANLIVANVDRSYPVGDGRRLPGCGAMVGAIVGATGHTPDFQVGKPNTYMLELLCREHGLSAAEICVVGDQFESDIKMANNFGCDGILFDPENAFTAISGKEIKNLCEIVSLLKGE
jgi:HAD superfamily hydrolase (TIGR01450 family)